MAPHQQDLEEQPVEQQQPVQHHSTPSFGGHKHKKFKQRFTRVPVESSRTYNTPESRESWGPNVKGKKFRKEKSKKKRCPSAGLKIDGSVKSTRLDAS